jgi:hypothetical protein
MTWRDADTAPAEVERELPAAPRRPALVEFGTAVLGIGGAFGLVQKLLNPVIPVTDLAVGGPLWLGLLLLDVLAVVAAVLLRRGTTWILAANVAAIYAFVHLLIPSLTGIVFSALYLAVVAACFLTRSWFDEMRDWRISLVTTRLSR